MPPDGNDAQTALLPALAREPAAVRALVDRLTPVVQARVARALLRRARAAGGRAVRQEVEDITQEVFLALFDRDARVLRAWDAERGLSLENFVGLVAERQAASILRSGRRSPWTEEPTAAEALDDQLPDADPREEQVLASDLLGAVLVRLRERASQLGLYVFEQLVVGERPVAEVCAETGLSRDAVYQWRSRMAALARQISRELSSEPRRRAQASGKGSPSLAVNEAP